MKNSSLAIVLLSLFLFGCATPGKVARTLELVALDCLKKGGDYVEAEKCLNLHRIKMEKINKEKGLDTYTVSRCRPSDRHIFVGACAGLYIDVKCNGQIEKWSIAKGYDGM